MKLWDYMTMYKEWVQLHAADKDIDITIYVDYENGEKKSKDKENKYMDKFKELLFKKVDIDHFIPDGIPVCNFSKIINENIELFKEHIKKYWKEECQWVLEQCAINSGDFAYELIKEFGCVICGDYGETVCKQYYNTLKKCKE